MAGRIHQRSISGTSAAVTSWTCGPHNIGDLLILHATEAAVTLTNGGNLKLDADWTSVAANDWIMLVCNDGTNWYEVRRRYPGIARVVLERFAVFPAAATAGNYAMLPDYRNPPVKYDSANITIPAMWYFDPEDHFGAATKCRLAVEKAGNNTALGTSVSVRLYPVTGTGGAAATAANFTIGSVVINTGTDTPGANPTLRGLSSAFTLAAGWYALIAILGGTVATNAFVSVRAELQSYLA